MKIIVAVDKHWAIGNRGRLLISIPADQAFFRQQTMGKTVVMGRKTIESLPGGLPLPGRRNLVLSKDPGYRIKGAEVFHTMEALMEELNRLPEDSVYIIGGESVYRQFLPYCHEALVTWIDYAYEADTCFPDLDAQSGWELADESIEQTYFDLIYVFRRYTKSEKN